MPVIHRGDEIISISQRLYPTLAQELILKRHCDDSRFVYNLGLEQRGLNRSIANQGWSQFRNRLEDKASAATFLTLVVPVPPAYTSQRCSECGHTEKKNRKNQASFSCVSCLFTANADVNAARNILAAGLAVAGRGGTPELVGPMKRQLEVGALV